MTNAILISGLGETAQSFGQGLQHLAITLGTIVGVHVTRYGYFDQEQIAQAARRLVATDRAILVGHSFGADVAVSVAREVQRPFDLILIDPVPVTASRRYFTRSIPLTDNVTSALCILRSTGFYPWSKPIAERGRRWMNTTGKGDHNGVMRDAATQRVIVEAVEQIAGRATQPLA